MLQFEQKHWSSGKEYIAGIDEAGRGPLAGPVIAASVILPHDIELSEVTDSKKISEKKRERLFDEIKNIPLIGHTDAKNQCNVLSTSSLTKGWKRINNNIMEIDKMRCVLTRPLLLFRPSSLLYNR